MRPWPVPCSEHPDAPAVAMCTVCDRFLCRACRQLDSDDLAICSACAAGRPAAARRRRLPRERVPFFETARHALLGPGQYALAVQARSQTGPALRFGLTCMVLGQVAFLTWVLLLLDPQGREHLAELAADLGLTPMGFQVLRFGLVPFEALARLAVYALLLQLGVLINDAARSLRYRDYIRLFSYASAGYLWLLVPLLAGVLLAFAYVILLCGQLLRVHHGFTGFQTVLALTPLTLGMIVLELAGGF